MKPWFLFAIVLVAAAAMLLWLEPFGDKDDSGQATGDREQGAAPEAPRLSDVDPETIRARERERAAEEAARAAAAAAPAAGTLPEPPPITGTVVDDETGKPIAGAEVWVEGAETPCPRLPRNSFGNLPANPGGFLGMGRHPRFSKGRTGADGTFALTELPGSFGSEGMDLFAWGHGYVIGGACAVDRSAPATLRLRRGLSIEGDVVGRDGRPVAGALVRADPAPGTTGVPGTREAAKTDDVGHFKVEGLVRASLVVTVDHPRFMPATLAPMEPGGPPVRVTLVPAFLAAFRVRTSDGGEAKNPSLAWRATGRGLPPLEEVVLLRPAPQPTTAADDPKPVDVAYVPVKVPCDRGEVTFQLKAEGYAPWAAPPEPLPPDGGEKTFDVTLERDLSLGALKVVLEDRDGNPLSFVGEGADARFARKDDVEVPAGIVMQPGEALVVPSIPAGPYVVFVRTPKHAPASVPVTVLAGGDVEAKAVLGPPARLRVKFTASERVTVKFRVLAGRDLAYPFPEGSAATSSTEEEGLPVFHAGEDGLVLTGLGPGPHTVEVVSPELAGGPSTVELVEGETREVEISVVRR